MTDRLLVSRNAADAHPVVPVARDLAPRQTAAECLFGWLLSRCDLASMAVFRIGFGLLMAGWGAEYLASGRVWYLYIVPRFHFTYFPFDWVRPLPGTLMYVHFVVLTAMALGIALGLFYRVSATLFAAGFTWFFLLERTNYQNHYYLVLLLSWLLPLLPLNGIWSLDARRTPTFRSQTAPTWALWLLRFHVALPYFFGGLAKLHPDWLAGQPMRMILAAQPRGDLLSQDQWVMFFTLGGLLFDLGIVPLLCWRRTRVLAYVLCVAFHVMNALLFQIHVFPWMMIFATTIFFEPGWPRAIVGISRQRELEPRPVSWSTLSRPVKWGMALGLGYCLFQCAWPLRHNLYAGDSNWTERGHLFSWHMMLRIKSSGVRYYMTDPRTGTTWNPDLRPYLNEEQAGKFSRDPEMIRQLARFLADEHRRRFGGSVEVRALVLTSLNGRKPQLFIDPTVDLAREPRGWNAQSWVWPLVEPLRRNAWNLPLTEWERHVDIPQFKTRSTNPAPAS